MNDYGIANYTILANGNMDGTWAHASANIPSTETAVKITAAAGLAGTYAFQYIEGGDTYRGRLTIRNVGDTFQFVWRVGGHIWFEGIGMLVSHNSISVAYRNRP